MEKTLVLLMGIQGSGKSTFYRKFLAEEYIRVNLDTLKTRNREKLLTESCIAEGKSYAVDNTNPTREDRQRYIPAARAAGYRVIGYWFPPDPEACMARNALREGKERIPEKGIMATWRKFEPPTWDEGFDELFRVENDGVCMTVCKETAESG